VRLGLASDSNGNVDALTRALEHFVRAQVERVYFLGAHLADLDAALAVRRGAPEAARLDPLDGRLVKVASRAGAEHVGSIHPTLQVDLVEGRICCLVHDKAELTRDDIENASLLFHGSTSAAGLVAIGPRVFVTPGPLRAPPGGGPANFAIVEVGAAELTLTVFGDDLAELRVERAPLAGSAAKLSVR
jgi:predicted phosphodiesterase